jgi:hypothetical protein
MKFHQTCAATALGCYSNWIVVVTLAAYSVPTFSANADSILLTTSVPYTQNFDTLANTGFSSSVPFGWSFVETGANANTTYAAADGTSAAGNTYSYGQGASLNRAFGLLASESLQGQIGASFTNGLGVPITSVSISFIAEQWRRGNGPPNTLTFAYSTNATSLTTGTWTAFPQLNINSIVTSGSNMALSPDIFGTTAAISATLTGLNIANGSSLFIRWADQDDPGADDALALDEFSLTPITSSTGSAVPLPAALPLFATGLGALGLLGWRRKKKAAALAA